MDILYWSDFNRFSIGMTFNQACDCSHPGPCDYDVEQLLQEKSIIAQLDAIPAQDITDELDEYGCWDKVELRNEKENRLRIVWIAAGNITEEV